MNRQEEQDLIKRTIAGDNTALGELYALHGSALLNLAYRTLLSREQAEDLIQELFVDLPQKLKQFRGDSGLGTWLYRIVVHRALDTKRQQSKRSSLLSQNRDEVTFIRANFESHETKDLLQKALKELDAEDRSFIWLKEAEGLEIKELAQMSGLAEGTIKSRLHRARKKMEAYILKMTEVSYETEALTR
jgi:RNA polymerase sigma-70 factor (ECF subfamily)